ncbi:MAG: Asp/Glu/hydantoin racemase [Proteobacteria bacterium]|nr:Asp/Glu/hydantoin racemase [Pseudomonadota bacterium]
MSIHPRDALAAHRIFIGTITPSGNTIVERVTLAVLRDFPEVSAHFSRTPVFGDRDAFPDSYDFEGMLAAARLLAHASPDVLVWNGSKGGSVDFALDHELVARIKDATGLACTTSVLALDEVLKAAGVRRFALVSPYDAIYQQKVIKTFARAGYDCVAEAHSDLRDNLSFAKVPAADIATMLRKVAAAKPEVIVTFCTNFPAATVVADMEAELGLPIFDSTLLPIWKGLKMAGVDTRRGRVWGSLFEH